MCSALLFGALGAHKIITMSLNYTLNINGKLLNLDKVKVMGILNVTDDSFYAGSRCKHQDEIATKVKLLTEEGADIIDIGACSTRPDAQAVDAEEECRRLADALRTIRDIVPDAILSVDTFRADIARMAVEEFGVAIVNDISAGAFDPEMFPTVAKLGVPYVLTHGCSQSECQHKNATSQGDNLPDAPTTANPKKDDTGLSDIDIVEQVMLFFSEKVQQLRDLGQKDIILDPGFGFGKTLDENYKLLANLNMLKILGLPILVGVSRKSMIYKMLGTTPDQALNGTTAIHTICLQQHTCDIIRAHDVRAAREAIVLTEKTQRFR